MVSGVISQIWQIVNRAQLQLLQRRVVLLHESDQRLQLDLMPIKRYILMQVKGLGPSSYS